MKIDVSLIIGVSLASLIITYLIVWGISKRNKNEKMTTAEGLNVAVFTLWAFAICLDIFFVNAYTFTVVKGIDMQFGKN